GIPASRRQRLDPTQIPSHLLLVQLCGRRTRTGSSTCSHSNGFGCGYPRYCGCGTMRMYGFGSSHSPKSSLASSFETEPALITSSPCFQFTGVETLCFAVSCNESMTRRTSTKLRPVVIG